MKATNDNMASVVRFAKGEGEVKVSDAGGELPKIENMRLFNGNSVATAQKSYAWLNLDDSKAIKLDAVSEAEVRKTGKDLEVLSTAGNLFFNVTEPLKSNESMHIRTSTMVMGIRGTCGWVKYLDGSNTDVYILEGHVECLVINPKTGKQKSVSLNSGEHAIFSVYKTGQEGEKSCNIEKHKFQAENVEGFVLTELATDAAKTEEIYSQSNIDLRNITPEDAQSQLAVDQSLIAQKVALVESEKESQDTAGISIAEWSDNPENTVPDTTTAENTDSNGRLDTASITPTTSSNLASYEGGIPEASPESTILSETSDSDSSNSSTKNSSSSSGSDSSDSDSSDDDDDSSDSSSSSNNASPSTGNSGSTTSNNSGRSGSGSNDSTKSDGNSGSGASDSSKSDGNSGSGSNDSSKSDGNSGSGANDSSKSDGNSGSESNGSGDNSGNSSSGSDSSDSDTQKTDNGNSNTNDSDNTNSDNTDSTDNKDNTDHSNSSDNNNNNNDNSNSSDNNNNDNTDNSDSSDTDNKDNTDHSNTSDNNNNNSGNSDSSNNNNNGSGDS
ncbi:MAG: hypothetical protein IJ679_07330, partial [Lachnospiraceae bacterium]|nr:hypothetical protein [Lachnospiraceae bacterium]